MRFCHPILSAEGQGANLLVATDIQWRPDGTGLEPVNQDEISSFGTLWSESKSAVSPGVGVGLIGGELMQKVSAALGSAEAKSLPFEWDDELGCWIAIGRRAKFDQCAKRLAKLSRSVFDRALRTCTRGTGDLSTMGAAALFVLRRTPGRRDTDVAMRELAAAYVRSEHDLYRRLLGVLSVRLHVSEDTLDKRVKRHVDWNRSAPFVRGLNLGNGQLDFPVQSNHFVLEPKDLGSGGWRSDDPLKAVSTYASKLPVDETDTAFFGEKVVSKPIVHSRRLEMAHNHKARNRQTNPDIREYAYGRRWNQTHLANG